MKYLASFRTTLKASRYMFRALALVLWLLIAFSSVFYIVNALHQRESEIRQEFNLSSDQAQRFIQRTSDVMKELKYIAEKSLIGRERCAFPAWTRNAGGCACV
ncbi:two-component system sensor kinase [Escherichia coli]|nr:two-component system sensor kinase [Escherichia coli]